MDIFTTQEAALYVRLGKPIPDQASGATHQQRRTSAQIIERPLNRFITIDWELAGVADPWEAQSCFIKLIRPEEER